MLYRVPEAMMVVMDIRKTGENGQRDKMYRTDDLRHVSHRMTLKINFAVRSTGRNGARRSIRVKMAKKW